MGSLTSELASGLVGGLDMLHRFDVTTRHWHRMRTDPEYARFVAQAFVRGNRKLKGQKVTLKFPMGSTRQSLLAAVKRMDPNMQMLREDIIMKLSTNRIDHSSTGGPPYKPMAEGSPVTLYLPQIGYHMDYSSAERELESRGLQEANTDDALLFALHGRMPQEGRVVVFGAQTFDSRGAPVALSLGRVIVGNPQMTLIELRSGFAGGTRFLAKAKPIPT